MLINQTVTWAKTIRLQMHLNRLKDFHVLVLLFHLNFIQKKCYLELKFLDGFQLRLNIHNILLTAIDHLVHATERIFHFRSLFMR